jgi:hypothetical protein
VGLEVIAELDGPNRIHRRTLSRLNKLDQKLRDWNTSAARAAVTAKLRASVLSACQKSKVDGATSAGCVTPPPAVT